MLVKPVKEIHIPETKFEYRKLKIEDCDYSPLNPSMRVSPKKIKPLATNIAKNGQNNPITVIRMNLSNKKPFRVVDGHRRCHAFESLNKTEIHGLILKNKVINYDKTFTCLHEDTMKITTSQECERWLKGASNITARTLNMIRELQTMLGKPTARNVIRRHVAAETSPHNTLSGMRDYRKYTGKKTRSDNKLVSYWLLNVGNAWKLRIAVESFS